MRFIVHKTGDDGKNLRVDLQGLRGFGVLLVIIGHLWLVPRGAFGALDIFFVLSGFFISEILIDHFGAGTLRFREFYLARTRRLAPTALTVIAVSVVLSHVLYTSAKAAEVDKEAFWTTIFASNWYFSSTGDNYFATISSSPLIHYWSLAVEEQFYVVWPLLIWVALRTARKRGWDISRTMFAVFGVLTVVSFGYSLWHSTAAPIAAYYSTFDRVWEFGIGGLVAVARPWLVNIPARIGTIFSLIMALGTAASIFILHYGQAFPAPWGLMPVLTCAGLIAAGVSGRATGPVLLTNFPMVYLGTISYSFYLWHLPVNFFLRSYFIEDTTLYKVVALVTGFVVSVLSFHLLERPMRRATWLMSRREKRRARSKPPIDTRPVKLGWLAVVAGLAGVLAFVSLAPTNASPGSNVGTQASPSPTKAVGQTPEQQQIDRVDAALSQTSFPKFSPALAKLRKPAAPGNSYCEGGTRAELGGCRFGSDNAAETAVVLGDSTAAAYAPGIQTALVAEGWSVLQLTRAECPAWTVTELPNINKLLPGCADHQRQALGLIRSQRPDMVIFTTAVDPIIARAANVKLPLQGVDLASSTLGQTIKAIRSVAKRVVVLESPPTLGKLTECVTRFSTPQDCTRKPNPNWYKGTGAERNTAKELGAEYVPALTWFCDAGCPAFMGSTPVTTDGTHLVPEFSKSLAPVLREALLGRAAN